MMNSTTLLDHKELDDLEEVMNDQLDHAAFCNGKQFQYGVAEWALTGYKEGEIKARRKAAVLEKLLKHHRGY